MASTCWTIFVLLSTEGAFTFFRIGFAWGDPSQSHFCTVAVTRAVHSGSCTSSTSGDFEIAYQSTSEAFSAMDLPNLRHLHEFDDLQMERDTAKMSQLAVDDRTKCIHAVHLKMRLDINRILGTSKWYSRGIRAAVALRNNQLVSRL